jgi:Na+-transporting NADH:ubiquinone oxidoreductase subunit NqrF
MKLTYDVALRNFEFWAGARQRAQYITNEQFDQIEEELEVMYPDGLTETELNDIFWFEETFIAQMLGFDEWEDLEEANS